MEKLQDVRHIVCRENRGRYRMRYLMPAMARFPYLLCIDSDARVVRPDFIRKYLSYAAAGTGDVIVGGLAPRAETVRDAGHREKDHGEDTFEESSGGGGEDLLC